MSNEYIFFFNTILFFKIELLCRLHVVQTKHRTESWREAFSLLCKWSCNNTLPFQSRSPCVFSCRWRTHKWHSCILVPDSVRRGLPGPGEACGKGLETRGRCSLSLLNYSNRYTCQLLLYRHLSFALPSIYSPYLMRPNSPFRSAPLTSKWWKHKRQRQFVRRVERDEPLRLSSWWSHLTTPVSY